MRKRYSITMDEDDHRRLTLEAVRAGKSLGDWLAARPGAVIDLGPNATKEQVETVKHMWLEESVDDIAKKAIEPEQVKVTNGRLSKGLGTIPGQDPPTPITRHSEIGFSKPAPKPGTKK